jgi:hypothetical protein
MLKNPNNSPSACFVPTGDKGLFRRFNSATGRPWDAGPGDEHGLYDRSGALHFGKLPRTMALDSAMGLGEDPSSAHYRHPSAPNNFQPAPELPRISAAGTRTRDQESGNGSTISKELASKIHDMAHRAGVSEPDMLGLGNALARITGTDPAAARDRGNGKISRDTARRAYDIASPKLSPVDREKLVQILSAMIDESLEDEGQGGQTGDQPPAFKGAPRPGGGMAGDAALAAFRAEYGLDRIKLDGGYGTPCPMRPKGSVHDQRLALDARQRAAGGNSGVESNPDLAAALAGMARIGRAY